MRFFLLCTLTSLVFGMEKDNTNKSMAQDNTNKSMAQDNTNKSVELSKIANTLSSAMRLTEVSDFNNSNDQKISEQYLNANQLIDNYCESKPIDRTSFENELKQFLSNNPQSYKSLQGSVDTALSNIKYYKNKYSGKNAQENSFNNVYNMIKSFGYSTVHFSKDDNFIDGNNKSGIIEAANAYCKKYNVDKVTLLKELKEKFKQENYTPPDSVNGLLVDIVTS